ncbi:MAG: hypothetical protein RJB66_175 [Pseudomonadota bacterium]|jgi:hypothetical protein
MNQFITKKIRSSVLAVALSSMAFASVGAASVALPPGTGPTNLVGATTAAESDLAGVVLHDKLIPFKILGLGGVVLFAGTLQNRVVKSNQTGNLHFYYRIRDTKSGLNGVVRHLQTQGFHNVNPLLADWRPDGLGTIHPDTAERSPGAGNIVRFNFIPHAGMVFSGGLDTKFVYLKTMYKKFASGGHTQIRLKTGESVMLPTVLPRL